MSLPIIVIGAGGHAAVVADALLAAGAQIRGFTDRDSARVRNGPVGLPVLGDDQFLDSLSPETTQLANGLGGTGAPGSTAAREQLQRRLEARGWTFAQVRHPTAIVSPEARLGPGVQLMAGSIVQPGAVIGQGAIVNTRALVEHDCAVGAFSHIAPGAILCGEVQLGARVHVGAGSVVRQGLKIGDDVVIGVGSAVVRDYDGNLPLAGVPARPIGE